MGKTSEHLPTFQDSFSAVVEGEGEGMSASLTPSLCYSGRIFLVPSY